MCADKLRNQQELERLQAKYVGTGHPDTTSWEWRTNIQRDTYSSIAGHRPLLSYIALAENEPVAKVRAQMIRRPFSGLQSPFDLEFERFHLADWYAAIRK
uniref:Splicing factor subunit n=1 Tax=Bionectria ochroleuca TaxID=29856 RepID=A0A0B7K0E0_BIOOC